MAKAVCQSPEKRQRRSAWFLLEPGGVVTEVAQVRKTKGLIECPGKLLAAFALRMSAFCFHELHREYLVVLQESARESPTKTTTVSSVKGVIESATTTKKLTLGQDGLEIAEGHLAVASTTMHGASINGGNESDNKSTREPTLVQDEPEFIYGYFSAMSMYALEGNGEVEPSFVMDNEIEVLRAANEQKLAQMRRHSTEHPFDSKERCNHLLCDKCYCYVCDVPARECQSWNQWEPWCLDTEILHQARLDLPPRHWRAVDKGYCSATWKFIREVARKMRHLGKSSNNNEPDGDH